MSTCDEDSRFRILLVFITQYYNGKFQENKKKFLSENFSNNLFYFLDECKAFSIYRFIIENDELSEQYVKKEVLKMLYHN